MIDKNSDKIFPKIGSRILIIGHPGAGKSTLSIPLGEVLNLPVHHLDRYFWKSGWVMSDNEEWHEKLQKLLKQSQWVIDGSYTNSLEVRLKRADTVINLDFPRWLCMLRIMKRIVGSFGRVRSDMADGCPEKLDISFQSWSWNYRKRHRVKAIDILSRVDDHLQIIVLKKPKEVKAFLYNLQHQPIDKN